MIRVVLADDHSLVREGVRHLLSATPDVRVVGEASDGDALLELLGTTPCDVALVDISMPGPGFQEVLRRIVVRHASVRTVVVSMQAEEQYALRAFRAGAMGYVGKDRTSEELVEAICRVHAGRRYVSPRLAEQLVAAETGGGGADRGLSEREFEVLRHLAGGKSPKEIGALLAVSPKTVSTYRARIVEKLGLETTPALVRFALDNGLLDDPPASV
jgi:two-component system invasion response regulator UvrY